MNNYAPQQPHGNSNETTQVLRKQANWEDLYFYQKTVVLYQLTFSPSLINGLMRRWPTSP